MEGKDLKKLLETTGLLVKYRNSEPGRKMRLPFIVFHFLESENIGADDKVYHQFNHFAVYLCTERLSETTEKKIEQVFDDASIFWNKFEDYIPEEQMYQISYEVTI